MSVSNLTFGSGEIKVTVTKSRKIFTLGLRYYGELCCIGSSIKLTHEIESGSLLLKNEKKQRFWLNN